MSNDLLDKASKAYYEGRPFLTDEEFDRLAEKVGYDKVGYNPDAKHKHTFPMYSLQKVFEGEDTPPEYNGLEVIDTPKLDGAAIAITYEHGKLVSVVTRGDGVEGVNITDKFMFTNIIPLTVGEIFLQVTGEIVAPKNIENARNYASGSLNLKSVEEFSKRDLTFIAYGCSPSMKNTFKEDMFDLGVFGFNTVTQGDWEQFPNDGRVIRVNDNRQFKKLGYTAHHPRGAYALKTREKGVVSTLLDVIWQTGKSGKVTPVAILEPVVIDDAVVQRATLNNMAYIENLNLEIGCQVEVIRSGKIIPCIVGRVQ